MKHIKIFETFLTEEDTSKPCTVKIADWIGKSGNVQTKATIFVLDQVVGDAKVNGSPLKAGAKVNTQDVITLTGEVTIEGSSTDENLEITCKAGVPKCVISGKE